jgi:hypothetical protein
VAQNFPPSFFRHAWRSVAGGSITRAERILIMDMQAYAGEHYYSVADFTGADGPVEETIIGTKTGKWDKPVLILASGNLLSLNVTNVRCLVKAWGRNSTDWLDKQVALFVGQVETQNGVQDAVLVRPLSPPLPAERRTKLHPEQKPEAKPTRQRPQAPKHDPGNPLNDPIDDLR